MMHMALLLIMLCGPGDQMDDAPLDACEEGTIRARSCAAAERWVRAGMRADQTLHILGCQEPNA